MPPLELEEMIRIIVDLHANVMLSLVKILSSVVTGNFTPEAKLFSLQPPVSQQPGCCIENTLPLFTPKLPGEIPKHDYCSNSLVNGDVEPNWDPVSGVCVVDQQF